MRFLVQAQPAILALGILACMSALCSNAQTVFVSWSYDEGMMGAADGSTAHPYPTLNRAIAGAPPGSTLAVQTGNYPEPCQFPLTIPKSLTMTQVGGPVLIGLPPGNQKICTTRITQLTGGYDPEGKPFLNDTAPWAVAGVDLGANTEFNGRLYFFFGDVVPVGVRSPNDGQWPPWDSDLIAYTQDSSPEPNGFRLTPVLKNGQYYPFTFKHPVFGPPDGIQILSAQTPTGAFSYDSKVYVFFYWVDAMQRRFSSLASSPDPSQPNPFVLLFDLVADGANPTKFQQVAPWVVRNSDIPNLPSAVGDGLIMFGQSGTPDGGGVFLAWMPLQPGRDPDITQIQYYTNNPTGNAPGWSRDESSATRLFKTKYFWTSLSVGRIPGTGQWMLLYQRSIRAGKPGEPDDPEESIVARVAATPWDFFDPTEAREIPILTPVRDGAYRVLRANGSVLNNGYMHRARLPAPDGLNKLPPIGGNGFAYGAYLLNRYTQWNATTRTVTIYYLMSTATPYQVQLMRSTIRITN